MVISHFLEKCPREPPNLFSSSNHAHPERKLTSCCKIVNYKLMTYTTNDIIAEPDVNIMNFKDPVVQSAL